MEDHCAAKRVFCLSAGRVQEIDNQPARQGTKHSIQVVRFCQSQVDADL